MQLPPPRLTSILLLLTLFLDQMINPLCSLPVCWGKDRARMSLDPVRVTLPVFWNYWTTPTALSKSRDYSTSDICFAFFFFHEEHIYANVEKVRLPSVPLCCVWSWISCYFFFHLTFHYAPLSTVIGNLVSLLETSRIRKYPIELYIITPLVTFTVLKKGRF